MVLSFLSQLLPALPLTPLQVFTWWRMRARARRDERAADAHHALHLKQLAWRKLETALNARSKEAAQAQGAAEALSRLCLQRSLRRWHTRSARVVALSKELQAKANLFHQTYRIKRAWAKWTGASKGRRERGRETVRQTD